MEKKNILWGSACLVIAVILGAFGAHGLKARLAPEALEVWKTAVEYQFYHGLGLLLLAGLGSRVSVAGQQWASRLLLLGILLFSGSLYILSTKELTGLGAVAAFLGPVTPIGGLCFTGGWVTLFITALRGTNSR
jgi:uncharacterized membrane protein YgdD (TMEM256/DUF423 family)